jgi:predicted AAA+ superfamily ATPase
LDYVPKMLYFCAVIIRTQEDIIRASLAKRKVVIVYGPRQVGKTTLVKKLYEEYVGAKQFIDCDFEDQRSLLTNISRERFAILLGDTKLLCIDEAQRVENIGLTLKIIHDNFKEVTVIATGSSSFEMANSIKEPLTGRKIEHIMLPFSTQELWKANGGIAESGALEQRLIYGYYPDVVNYPVDAQSALSEIANSYLYKDIFQFEEIRNSELLNKLLAALAYQVGNQVSFNELAKVTKSSPKTVERYIELLEQSFVIFRLNSYSKNLRNELSKSKKIYFYDNGIRNAIVGAFQPLSNRNDIGALWENYLVSERYKYWTSKGLLPKSYFWRTTQQQEVDYLEMDQNEQGEEELHTYEMKFNSNKKARLSKTFSGAYTNHSFSVINSENYWEFVGVK